MKKLVIKEITTTIDDTVENVVDTSQYNLEYEILDTKQVVVDDDVSSKTIYEGLSEFDYVRVVSDQEITLTLKEDIENVSTSFYSQNTTNFETEKNGSNLKIVVSNDSGYSANIKILVAKKV